MTLPVDSRPADISQDDFEALLKAAMNASWNDGKRGATETSERACDTSDKVVEAFIALRSALTFSLQSEWALSEQVQEKGEALAAAQSALTADASRLDYIENRLKATGEVYLVRTIDGDMQMNTADCVGSGSGSTLRDVIDAEMKESERG